ncbi:hypothetical protein PVOR_24724 [Paenibacillus vortex V453]|uniref:Uncharacterized protein n=1 Tax=Paenibacillus vortex V453 TaxID=715225 RepID=A0A2R9SQA2_9BACL|nr:hypothetical protein PVOR_24724 [Paenibacillus vortex V453]
MKNLLLGYQSLVIRFMVHYNLFKKGMSTKGALGLVRMRRML